MTFSQHLSEEVQPGPGLKGVGIINAAGGREDIDECSLSFLSFVFNWNVVLRDLYTENYFKVINGIRVQKSMSRGRELNKRITWMKFPEEESGTPKEAQGLLSRTTEIKLISYQPDDELCEKRDFS